MWRARRLGLLACAAALALGAGCKRARASFSPQKPDLPRGPGAVLVAAAGDISPDALGRQQDTAALIEAGGFEAVLLTGDVQYPKGALDDFRRYFDPTWGRFKERLWPVPGNHEYGTPSAAGYFAYFGARAGAPDKGYYSFDLGAWHLVALNTNNACRAVPCGPGSAQLAWLEADLAANQKKCTLAYWHHPRFSSGPHGGFEGAAALWSAVARHGVELVLNGHDHIYERLAPLSASGEPAPDGGTVQLTVGTGGAELYELAAVHPRSLVRDARAHGVLALSLMEEGYAFEFLAVPPSTFKDKGQGACR